MGHAGTELFFADLRWGRMPIFLAHSAHNPLNLSAVDRSILVEHLPHVTFSSIGRSKFLAGRSREQYLHTIASCLINSAQNGHFFCLIKAFHWISKAGGISRLYFERINSDTIILQVAGAKEARGIAVVKSFFNSIVVRWWSGLRPWIAMAARALLIWLPLVSQGVLEGTLYLLVRGPIVPPVIITRGRVLQ